MILTVLILLPLVGALVTAFVPAATTAANGGRSRSRSTCAGTSTVGSARCESTMVAPWPGKCLAQVPSPASTRPAAKARAWAATRSGSSPKARVPITGFSGSDAMSRQGARSRSTPARAST